MIQLIKRFVKNLPEVKNLLEYQTHWKPGHYYSPIPDGDNIAIALETAANPSTTIKDIDLRDKEQLALFTELAKIMSASTFTNADKVEGYRFYNSNRHYAYSDSLILEAMIRHLQPKRIIEAGSGFTSALMLDTNQKYFNNGIDITFIEPYPERLMKLLSEEDKKNVTLKLDKLQSIDLNVFRQLQANDILFIDSTHVAKAGSDLLYLFFEILPVINPGVYIHFHDIFNNFEYQTDLHFSNKGFGWNECYFLRAFLMNNPRYEVVLFSNYLDTKYGKQLQSIMPAYPLFKGAQFWMRKV